MEINEYTSSTAVQPGPGAGTQLEKLPVLIYDDPGTMSEEIAQRIATLIRTHQAAGRPTVLGLPTGSTPVGVYQRLARLYKDGELDFSTVITFNLDEYYPIEPDSIQSYHRFMWENLFNYVNVRPENIHIPKGNIPRSEVEKYCREYEQAIVDAGGLDLVLLGIGRSGHIGFNEPGSGQNSRTRLVKLDEITRKDAAADFFGDENVPREGITMGVGTILDAREIILIATGEHKAPILRRAVEEEPDRRVTASFLQLHGNTTVYADRAAASELTREKTPWLVRDLEWDEDMTKRAVIWLSEKLGKAILRLEASDFYRNHLHDLVHAYGDVDELCRKVFEGLRQHIMYRDSLPRNQRIVVFSPHPDDDVISMGGMLEKIASNGNDVTVAYMTNGSVAVFDADVRRMLRFVELSQDVLGIDEPNAVRMNTIMNRMLEFLKNKQPGTVDLPEVQAVKAFIRYAEAISALEVIGLSEENARFLDMPFYRTGMVRKDLIGEADVQVVLNLLNEVKPDHIFVAGDLSDPHGTHRMCYDAIKAALARYNAVLASAGDGVNATEGPLVWLYRGAWQEWEIHRADVFLPLSKADLDRKIEAIFRHESQKDRAMFPGAYDEREFWQRARDRNQQTANTLNQLGLPEFFAAEAYVTTRTMP